MHTNILYIMQNLKLKFHFQLEPPSLSFCIFFSALSVHLWLSPSSFFNFIATTKRILIFRGALIKSSYFIALPSSGESLCPDWNKI